jgi:CelD/BcsL family acetyltransferase involved in cellulose biosynthesis
MFQGYSPITFALQSATLQRLGLAARGITSNFLDTRLIRFYERLLVHMSALGMLRVFCAELGQQLLAYRTDMIVDDVLYDWLTAYDHQYAKYSLGTLLLDFMVSSCIDSEVSEIDMMRGDESYKRHWAHCTRDVVTYARSTVAV